MTGEPEIPPLTLRYLVNSRHWRTEITYLAYQSGLRNYCWVHDRLRWAWTHRNCARRHHSAAQRIASIIHRGNRNG